MHNGYGLTTPEVFATQQRVGDAAPRVVGRDDLDDTHGTGVAADDGGRADWHYVAMIDRHQRPRLGKNVVFEERDIHALADQIATQEFTPPHPNLVDPLGNASETLKVESQAMPLVEAFGRRERDCDGHRRHYTFSRTALAAKALAMPARQYVGALTKPNNSGIVSSKRLASAPTCFAMTDVLISPNCTSQATHAHIAEQTIEIRLNASE